MPSLQVREVPAAVYGALAEEAKAEHRSLSQQTLVALQRGLGLDRDPRQRRRRLVEQIARTPMPGVAELPDPAGLLREDRAR